MDLTLTNTRLLDLIERLLPQAVEYGIRIIGAVLLFLAGKLLIRFVLQMLHKTMARTHLDPTLIEFGSNLVKLVLTFLVILMAANTLGFQTTSFLALIGTAGLAIGLALKGSLDNVASGVMVVALRQIHVGDYILIDGQEGFVDSLQVFNTTLRTRDNRTVILPNSLFTSKTLINYSTRGSLRLEMVVRISSAEAIGEAQEVLAQALQSHPQVLADPAPLVGIRTLNDSNVDLEAFAWVKVADYWTLKWELLKLAQQALNAHGIATPLTPKLVEPEGETPSA